MTELNTKILFCLLTVAIVFTYSLKPKYNWDVLPYMSHVLQVESPNKAENHVKLYSFVKEELGEKRYKGLTQNKYQLTMAENADAFSEQLPFYSIKYLYIYSSYLFYKTGASLGVIALLKKSPFSINYFFISLLIRPDNIVFLSLLFALILIFQKVDRLKYLINLVVFMIVYFTLQSFSENAGWQVLYYHAFVEYLYFPLTSPAELNFSLYLAGLVKQLPLFLAMISTVFAGSYYIFKKTLFRFSDYKRVEIILITSSISCFIIRYFLFPTIELRFNMIFIIIYALSLLSLFESLKKSGKITV